MRELCALIACGVILLVPGPAGAQDKSGAWTGVVTESASDCRNIVKARPGEYRLTFVQKGDELLITEAKARRPYRGFFGSDTPGQIQVRGTYADAGGYVTEEVFIRFAGGDSGTGQSVWRWSDGWHQCGGRFRFTLKKNRPE
ncbi:MAG: hypothetical protein MUD16_13310 [Desulfobacterales bacterium]|jgi:hypothetical protein|nr:hypothetical protein [Desulfobacterales bacterium]